MSAADRPGAACEPSGSGRPSRIRLVADDLTGALDSAVQFTGVADLRVVMAWRGDERGHSLAHSLGSRDGSRAKAVAASEATAGFFQGAAIAFKKVDSLLRGHWAAEIAALAQLRLFARIVLAPAFPAQGRVTRDGRQHWRTSDGLWHPLAVDMAEALAAEGLTATRFADGRGAGDVVLLDAETEDDLEAIAAVGARLDGPVLWCGAAGLARALAGAPPRQARLGEGPHLGRLETAGSPLVLRCAPEDRHAARAIRVALDRDGVCAALCDLPDGTPPAVAARQIAAWLGTTLPDIAPPATLTVVGGETLAAVCAALDVAGLDLRGELAAGIPCSMLVGGPWDGVTCVSKSGAFGAGDWLHAHLGQPAGATVD